MKIDQMFEKLWNDYTTLNPSVAEVYKVFTDKGEKVFNDHVAFRTYNHPKIGLKKVAQFFTDNGYTKKGDYSFKVKKLYAEHFEHKDPTKPKIFVSELLVEQFSPALQKKVNELVEQVTPQFTAQENFCVSGKPWSVSFSEYQKLLEESEYAAWMAAFGFRANHFTVLVNSLKKLTTLEAVNDAILTAGFKLNTSGGVIKGTEEIGLRQSSTLAEPIAVKFTDSIQKIPGCYYEFAQRFKVNGELYGGFVEQSADKIFESTNVKR